jgi:imidazole glycerol-phosphate synthase subunit HisH
MIAIIDYGVGNLKSVYKALVNLGFKAIITSNEDEINSSKAMILPGVGAYKDAMDNLGKSGLISCIKGNIAKGKPTLGICLGMQLFYDKSYEDGEYEGLGILKGEIIRFEEGLKIPHMGWNSLVKETNDEIAEGISEGEHVYFVHSYYLKPEDNSEVVLWSDYGVKVPAVVRKDNVIGMQFHPEKSSDVGMKLLKNFGELIL